MKLRLLVPLVCMILSCDSLPKAQEECDKNLYHEYKREPCGFRVCYPKDWVDSYPDRGFVLEKYAPGRTLQDDSLTSIHVFSNFTLNGRNAMGDFEQYVDSSRRQIYSVHRDVRMVEDVDTVWGGLRAHWFSYDARFIYRTDTLRITQLAISAPNVDLQYVLTFTENKGTEDLFAAERETFFHSFAPSEKCN